MKYKFNNKIKLKIMMNISNNKLYKIKLNSLSKQ